MFDFDMLVIGCGPGGQKAAIAAAKLSKRAGVVERADVVGGVCVNTGTIPSKTLRETVLYLTGLTQRELYGQSYRVKDNITMDDLNSRTHHVVARESKWSKTNSVAIAYSCCKVRPGSSMRTPWPSITRQVRHA